MSAGLAKKKNVMDCTTYEIYTVRDT